MSLLKVRVLCTFDIVERIAVVITALAVFICSTITLSLLVTCTNYMPYIFEMFVAVAVNICIQYCNSKVLFRYWDIYTKRKAYETVSQ